MTSVGFQPAFGCAPQFGIRRAQPEAEPQLIDTPVDEYGSDTRSQRLGSGAKKLGLSILLSLVSSAAFLAAPKQMTNLIMTKGGMIGLSAYGLLNSGLGIWGLVDLGRGLFTKAGQYRNQPAAE